MHVVIFIRPQQQHIQGPQYQKCGDESGNEQNLPNLDAGTGDSDLTWNAMAGLSYAYGWGELLLAYRHLAYDQASDKLLQDFSFSGLGLGARFNFD